MTVYCEDADVYAFGLPAGVLANPARPVAVNVSSGVFTLDMHGLGDGDTVSFRADAGGSLPTGLVDGTTYYVSAATQSRFRVSATSGGAAVALTGTAARVVVIHDVNILAAREFGSRVIDDMLPAHLVPLELPVPDIVRITCAELAAQKLLTGRAGSKTLTDMIDAAQKRIARWAKNVPIRGTNAPAAAQLAASSGVQATAGYRDCKGWNRFGGTE